MIRFQICFLILWSFSLAQKAPCSQLANGELFVKAIGTITNHQLILVTEAADVLQVSLSNLVISPSSMYLELDQSHQPTDLHTIWQTNFPVNSSDHLFVLNNGNVSALISRQTAHTVEKHYIELRLLVFGQSKIQSLDWQSPTELQKVDVVLQTETNNEAIGYQINEEEGQHNYSLQRSERIVLQTSTINSMAQCCEIIRTPINKAPAFSHIHHLPCRPVTGFSLNSTSTLLICKRSVVLHQQGHGLPLVVVSMGDFFHCLGSGDSSMLLSSSKLTSLLVGSLITLFILLCFAGLFYLIYIRRRGRSWPLPMLGDMEKSANLPVDHHRVLAAIAPFEAGKNGPF